MFSQSKISCLLLVSFVSALSLAGCDSTKQASKAEKLVAGDSDKPKGFRMVQTSRVDSAGPGASDDTASDSDAKSTEPEADAPVAETPEAETAGFEVAVAEGGALKFTAPASWEKAKPRSSYVEYEIAVPKSEGESEDAANGRLTISGAGGDIEANIARWRSQYTQPDGSSTEDNSTVVESKVAGCDVTWVDIKGTLMDRPGGPFAGGEVVERENYRMLGSIVQAGEHGQYFVKFYGPEKTISDNEAFFKAFVESLKINDGAKGQ